MTGAVFSRMLFGLAAMPAMQSIVQDSSAMQRLVHRFVAGESLDEAMQVAHDLGRSGIAVSLDNLGENTNSRAEADRATEQAVEAVARISADKIDGYVSVKLSQLGIDLGDYVAIENAERLAGHAARLGIFIRLDMEGSSYTARTVELFEQLYCNHANIGIVIQAYLYRSRADVERLTDLGASIRLCKGAYSEPPHIAYRRKRDTDRNYVCLMEYLLLRGTRTALATHDEAIIHRAIEFVAEHNLDRTRFEFQMLYGIRRDLQTMLVNRGFGVRVYVPYGSQWYPYLTRRLAERPANILSMGMSIRRERKVRSREVALRS